MSFLLLSAIFRLCEVSGRRCSTFSRRLAVTSEGCVVAWHPAKPFPYKHSKPLSDCRTADANSLLSDSIRLGYKTLRLGRGPTVPDCQNMFYANKHTFYTKVRELIVPYRKRRTFVGVCEGVTMCKRLVNVVAKWLGTVPYQEALKWQTMCQRQLAESTSSIGQGNTLLLLEHFPVYTVGLRGRHQSADLDRADETRLECLGADFYRTNRGGLVTFHGPGQLVAYPILRMTDFHGAPFARWYVEKLETCLLETCLAMGLNAYAPGSPLTGVWIGDRKVASIGLRIKDGISSHGVALNCDIDLSWFNHIDPCGLVGRKMTSLSQELDTKVGVRDVIPSFLKAFERAFSCAIAFTEERVQPAKIVNSSSSSESVEAR